MEDRKETLKSEISNYVNELDIKSLEFVRTLVETLNKENKAG